MKTAVVLNPKAGSVGDVAAIRARLEALRPSEFLVSQRPEEATAFARQAAAAGVELIVSAGGDGTLNEVVNGIAETNTAIALVPLGTGNDFARSIRIPDLETAFAQIASANFRAIDLVRVTSDAVRHYVNVSSGGFSGLVDEKLTPEMKQTWGPLAYLRSAAAAFSDLRAYRTQIVLDDTQTLEEHLYNVIIANGSYVAGGIPIAPSASLTDGLLDIVLLRASSNTALALVAPQILLGKHLDSDAVVFLRARKVSLKSQPGMWFNVDGELVGNEPATFEALPRALRCIVGPDENA
ncbi:MAG: diacylglycerol kinase family lipid kinase [Verrucomicrobiota bacterium]|nr:diacylglycerol kinase family lipid kinase [Verrucomicrobiota bacterium]